MVPDVWLEVPVVAGPPLSYGPAGPEAPSAAPWDSSLWSLPGRRLELSAAGRGTPHGSWD